MYFILIQEFISYYLLTINNKNNNIVLIGICLGYEIKVIILKQSYHTNLHKYNDTSNNNNDAVMPVSERIA